MGLESCWRLPEGVVLEFEPGLSTLGLEKGRHLRSFRGKLFDRFFAEEVGVSLYEEMPPETVQSVAATLLGTEYEPHFAEEYRAPEGPDQFRDLQRMFQGYAEAGASLQPWY